MKATRDKYENDPLVPIRGDRVRAALEREGWTVSELARRVSASQPRIDLIVRGKTSRCRRSLRARIAQVLGTSVRVLAGGEYPLARHGFYDWEASELIETPIVWRQLWLSVSKSVSRDRWTIVGADGIPPLIRQASQGSYWREQLLKGADPSTMNLEDLSLAERDRLTALIAEALLLVLRPWFDGRAGLKNDGRAQVAGGNSIRT